MYGEIDYWKLLDHSLFCRYTEDEAFLGTLENVIWYAFDSWGYEYVHNNYIPDSDDMMGRIESEIGDAVTMYKDCEKIVADYGINNACYAYSEWCEIFGTNGEFNVTDLAYAVLYMNLPSGEALVKEFKEKYCYPMKREFDRFMNSKRA